MWFPLLLLLVSGVVGLAAKVVVPNVVEVRIMDLGNATLLQQQLDAFQPIPSRFARVQEVLVFKTTAIAEPVGMAEDVDHALFARHQDFPGGYVLYVLPATALGNPPPVGVSTLGRFGWVVAASGSSVGRIYQAATELLSTVDWREGIMSELDDLLQRTGDATAILHAQRSARFVGLHNHELAAQFALQCREVVESAAAPFSPTANTHKELAYAITSLVLVMGMGYMVWDAKTSTRFHHHHHPMTTTPNSPLNHAEFCTPTSRLGGGK